MSLMDAHGLPDGDCTVAQSWQSNATWDKSSLAGLRRIRGVVGLTTRRPHGSREEAERACVSLAEGGLRGDVKVKPLRVWVSGIDPDPKLPDNPECVTCRSTGFPVSVLGPHRCQFCDGSAGDCFPRPLVKP